MFCGIEPPFRTTKTFGGDVSTMSTNVNGNEVLILSPEPIRVPSGACPSITGQPEVACP